MTTHAPYKPGAHVRPLLPRPGRNRQARPAAAGCHAIAREQPRRPGNRLSPRSARPPRPAPASRARERHPRPSPGTAGPHRGGRWGPAAWPGEQVSHPRRAGMPGWAVRGSCGPAGHAPPSPHSRQEGPRPDPAAARRAPRAEQARRNAGVEIRRPGRAWCSPAVPAPASPGQRTAPHQPGTGRPILRGHQLSGYTADELAAIFAALAEEAGFTLTPAAAGKAVTVLGQAESRHRTGNARLAIRLLDQAASGQASRATALPAPGPAILSTSARTTCPGTFSSTSQSQTTNDLASTCKRAGRRRRPDPVAMATI